MREEAETVRAVERYSDLVRRVCLCHLKSREDTEDVSQAVFLKYLLSEQRFESPEHEKAWFLRVTMNACKDQLKSLFRHRTLPLDALREEPALEGRDREVLEAVLSLPEKYKDVIYLHYYEGYSAAEIGAIMGMKENTVYSLLSRGRALLRDWLGGDGLGE